MQQPTVLQPDASGTGDTPGEPEKKGLAEDFESFVMFVDSAIGKDSAAHVKHAIANGVGIIDGFKFIDDPIYSSNGVPKVKEIYDDPADQELYVKFCSEGMKPAQAQEAMTLMGIEKSPLVSVPYSFFGDEPFHIKKKVLPFYHHKRRF